MLEIVIVGVGGQGTLLASRIFGKMAMNAGREVKVSEVHGMSQRGGSVITYVRIGDEGEKVYAPVVSLGTADVILSFEQLEAYRALPYLKEGGVVVTGDQEIMPMPVISGAAKYPENLIEKTGKHAKVHALDALQIARECGSERCANVVLVGLLAKYLPFSMEEAQNAVAQCVPPKTVEMNLKAFAAGYNAVE